MQQTSSMLTETFLAPILATAQRKLEREGALAPTLFLKPQSGAPLEFTPRLPYASERRQRFFAKLGRSLRRSGLSAVEAVLLMDSWIVQAKRAPTGLSVRPSEAPDRQEAIVLIGRNADGTRVTRIIQPYRHDAQMRLVWETRPLAVYDQPVETEGRTEGLLDYLFAASEGR